MQFDEEKGVVYMTKQEFDVLLEYSTSNPTGTYIGKRWKRNCAVADWVFEARKTPDRWIMGEYQEIPDSPKEVGIRWRDIVIGKMEDALDFQI